MTMRGGGIGGSGTPGATGAPGPGVLTTSGQPANGTGVDTQYAFDPATFTWYGPKAAGVWPTGTVSKGLGWVYGVGAPNDADGQPNGTQYFDQTTKANGGNGAVYVKQSGTYGTPVTFLFGADGADGNAAATFKGWNVSNTGTTPAASLGNVGELAVDNSYASPLPSVVYGPKQTSSAPVPANFWGINLHISSDYTLQTGNPWKNITVSGLVSYLTDLNTQIFRNNISGTSFFTGTRGPDNIAKMNALIDAGMTCMIVVDLGVSLSTTEAANLSTWTTLCTNIANQVNANIHNPTAVIWEITNERDYLCRIDIPSSQGGIGTAGAVNPIDGFGPDGSVRSDFIDSAVAALAGAVRGGIAGVRSVFPSAQCGMATGNPYSYVVQEMIFKGMNTSGAITRTPIPGSNFFACIHWYSSMNNILAAGPSNHWNGKTGGTGSYAPDAPSSANKQPNVPALVNARLPGFPIIISEWGGDNVSTYTDAMQASYMTSQGTLYFNNRTTYGIQAIMMYALFPNDGEDATNFGLVGMDGVTKKAAYSTFKNLSSPTGGFITQGGAGWPTTALGVIPKVGDIPSTIGLTAGASAAEGRFSNGTNAYTLRWYEATDANGSFTNTSYAYLSFSGGFGQINTGASGTGSAKAIQLGLNGVSLYQVSASFFGPIVTGKNNGQLATRWLNTFTQIINIDSQIFTASQTLNTSTPTQCIANSASALTLTVPASPNHGTILGFNNVGAGLLTISYTGRTGATTTTVAQDNYKELYYNSTLAYWMLK